MGFRSLPPKLTPGATTDQIVERFNRLVDDLYNSDFTLGGTYSQNITFKGYTIFGKDVGIHANLSVQTLFVTTIQAVGNSTIAGNQTVAGNSTVGGNETVTGTLTCGTLTLGSANTIIANTGFANPLPALPAGYKTFTDLGTGISFKFPYYLV